MRLSRISSEPLRFFHGDLELTPTDHRPPPTLDQHGAQVRAELGIDLDHAHEGADAAQAVESGGGSR